jgi:hypothetical protein
MKEIASNLRKAIIDSISPLIVQGTTIPIFDEMVNPNSQLASFSGSQAYVLIREQNETETTDNKCGVRQSANITVDIVTKYPLNGGGKKACEDISNVIQLIIDRFIIITGWQVLNVRKEFSRNLIEQGQTLTAYRKLINYTFDVFEE